MKSFLFFTLFLFHYSTTDWLQDFDTAKQQATNEHKFILLNFSGSDWCGPCIRMRKEIFNTDRFRAFAADQLVLVNADFPRLKKNALPAVQQAKNDQLASLYNNSGKFPLTLLLTAGGKVMQRWEGAQNKTPEAFVAELESLLQKTAQ